MDQSSGSLSSKIVRRIHLKNLVVLQSGGPTSVLNASLVGIIHRARNSFGRVFGVRRGFEGLVKSEVVELSALSDATLDRFARTPSAGLGTSRLRPSDDQLDLILDEIQALDATALVGIGGNDTADSLMRLEAAARKKGSKLQVIGLPKTIDNDLAITDHSLGYPSAARVIAAFTRDALVDTLATSNLYPLKFIEVMGRNAGWLAAAGALWIPENLPTPLIALPERPFDSLDDFLQRISQSVDGQGFAVVVLPETMRWSSGEHVSGNAPEWVDAFGHPYFASAGQALLRACGVELGLRGKLDRPGSVSRSSIDYAATVDLDEAYAAGGFATQSLIDGRSGSSVVITRTSSEPYAARMQLAPLAEIANVEFRMPDSFYDLGTGRPSPSFAEYALPLVGPSTTDYAFIDWYR